MTQAARIRIQGVPVPSHPGLRANIRSRELHKPLKRKEVKGQKGKGETGRPGSSPSPLDPLAPSLSDPELVARCLARDAEAWRLLVRRYRRLVYSVPHHMGVAREEADEVFQETFVALLEKLPQVRDRERLGAWLTVTARRKTLDRLTRGPRRHEKALPEGAVEIAAAAELPLEAMLRLERQNEVRLALTMLPAACRALLEALFYEDPPLSYDQVAARLQVPRGSLGPNRGRCFERLRQALHEVRGDAALSNHPKPASNARRKRSS